MLYNTVFTLFVAALSSIGIYAYAPLSWFESGEPTLGASITTIQGSDTISSSRTTINNNFEALNTYKIENSTTSVASITTLANLSTIGTITSGTWNGSTIGVAYGGTGSTTLSSNQVLLGNGASGFKTVSGLGTSGFFLRSNGAGTPPTWEAATADQTANYAWTGYHSFASMFATNATATNATTTGTLGWGTTPYRLPSTPSASGTVLMVGGTSPYALSWDFTNPRVLLQDGFIAGSSGTTATTTNLTLTIPAGTLANDDTIRIYAGVTRTNGGAPNNICPQIDFGSGSATTTLNPVPCDWTQGMIDVKVSNLDSLSSQNARYHMFNDNGSVETFGQVTPSVNTANQFYIAFRGRTTNSGDALNFTNVIVELIR